MENPGGKASGLIPSNTVPPPQAHRGRGPERDDAEGHARNIS